MNELLKLAELDYRLVPTKGKGRLYSGDDVPLEVTLAHARRGGGVAILLKNGLTVLDQDGPNLGTLSDLQSSMVAKSSKPDGRHWFFRTEAPGTNKIKPVIEGRKIQADLLFNGIVRIPPGDNRKWLTPLLRIEELPVFPMELLKETRKEVSRIIPTSLSTPTVEGMRKWIRRVQARGHAVGGPGRDRDVFRVAIKIVSVVPSFDEALAELFAWQSEGHCLPPLTEKELAWKVTCSLNYLKEKP